MNFTCYHLKRTTLFFIFCFINRATALIFFFCQEVLFMQIKCLTSSEKLHFSFLFCFVFRYFYWYLSIFLKNYLSYGKEISCDNHSVRVEGIIWKYSLSPRRIFLVLSSVLILVLFCDMPSRKLGDKSMKIVLWISLRLTREFLRVFL